MRASKAGLGWRVARYAPEDAARWDALVASSGNGPFVFGRSYLDYHADRFVDCSWLVWHGTALKAGFVAGVARATAAPTVLVAHPGLAYGGLFQAGLLPYKDLADILNLLCEAWRKLGFRQLQLRLVPRAFCRLPSDGLAFWLHQQGAQLTGRELNSVIDLTQNFRIGTWRRNNLRQARQHGVRVGVSLDYAAFWTILTENLLQSHGQQPVHTLAEIELLARQNSGHLTLYAAFQAQTMVAGVVLYQDERQDFAHTQYIAGSPQGKRIGAVDAVLGLVIETVKSRFARLSFGISTVHGVLNPGLLTQKEGFGAAAEVQDMYLLDL